MIPAENTTVEIFGVDLAFDLSVDSAGGALNTRLTDVESAVLNVRTVLSSGTVAAAAGIAWNPAKIGPGTNCTVATADGIIVRGNDWFLGLLVVDVSFTSTNFRFSIDYPDGVVMGTVPTTLVGCCNGHASGVSVTGAAIKNAFLVNGIEFICVGSAGTGTVPIKCFVISTSGTNSTVEEAVSIGSGTNATTHDHGTNSTVSISNFQINGTYFTIGEMNDQIFRMNGGEGQIGGMIQGESAHHTGIKHFVSYSGSNTYYHKLQSGSFRLNAVAIEHGSTSYTPTISNRVDVTTSGFNFRYKVFSDIAVIWGTGGTITPTIGANATFDITLPPGYTLDGEVWGGCNVENDGIGFYVPGPNSSTISFHLFQPVTVTPAGGAVTHVLFMRVNDI